MGSSVATLTAGRNAPFETNGLKGIGLYYVTRSSFRGGKPRLVQVSGRPRPTAGQRSPDDPNVYNYLA
jgi:hypothetical protein